ncbi:hypothetical protein V8F33_012469 [Rhypophila sp. PSN 637]
MYITCTKANSQRFPHSGSDLKTSITPGRNIVCSLFTNNSSLTKPHNTRASESRGSPPPMSSRPYRRKALYCMVQLSARAYHLLASPTERLSRFKLPPLTHSFPLRLFTQSHHPSSAGTKEKTPLRAGDGPSNKYVVSQSAGALIGTFPIQKTMSRVGGTICTDKPHHAASEENRNKEQAQGARPISERLFSPKIRVNIEADLSYDDRDRDASHL